MISRWFQKPRTAEAERPRKGPPRVPSGLRVYVVGDIHGRIDLIQAIDARIARDIDIQDPATNVVVYLGDYVDRGYNSREVLDHLIDNPVQGVRPVWLIGNHDVWLRDFARDKTDGASWFAYGGDATLVSYGVRLDPGLLEQQRLAHARAQLIERLPERHLDFIDSMELGFSLGDYFFVHAGVNPARSLEDQKSSDMLWIRDQFLAHTGDYGKIVVHGHTVVDRPEIYANRIAIDTGACWTGRLTCLVLQASSMRFLGTGDPPRPLDMRQKTAEAAS